MRGVVIKDFLPKQQPEASSFWLHISSKRKKHTPEKWFSLFEKTISQIF